MKTTTRPPFVPGTPRTLLHWKLGPMPVEMVRLLHEANRYGGRIYLVRQGDGVEYPALADCLRCPPHVPKGGLP